MDQGVNNSLINKKATLNTTGAFTQNELVSRNSMREYSEILKIKTKKRACSALKVKKKNKLTVTDYARTI